MMVTVTLTLTLTLSVQEHFDSDSNMKSYKSYMVNAANNKNSMFYWTEIWVSSSISKIKLQK